MKNRILHIGWLLGLCLTVMPPAQAQKEGAVWYFGQYAGLDFNQYYPRPLTDGKINTREGVASICDSLGNLLFYTDGSTVWNRNHQIMDGGTGLFGNTSSTQSSIVVPKPGSTVDFYIFTVDKVGENGQPGKGINYSRVNMLENQGLGRVVSKNQPLFAPATEKITAVRHLNGRDYWIIGHKINSNIFKIYLLNKTGLSQPTEQAIGLSHNVVLSDRNNRGAVGYMKSSPKGDYVAVALEGQKLFEIFPFDNRSGQLGNPITLYAGEEGNPNRGVYGAYGLEFSPTSNYFYGSTRKGGGLIYRWNLQAGSAQAIRNSMEILQPKLPPNILCGAMQLAFNGKIYVTFSGQSYLGVINAPTQQDCNYRKYGTNLLDNETGRGGKAYYGLPTFLPDFFKAARFYYENTCQFDKTVFYLSSTLLDEPPVWNIYDSVGSAFITSVPVDFQTWTGTYTFTEAGTYIVELVYKQNGVTDKQKREITIHPIPKINFGDTTTMCGNNPAILDAGYGAFYEWSDNSNLSLVRYRTINSEGWYRVKLTHYNGCFNIDSTYVMKKPLPVVNYEVIEASCGNDNGQITLRTEDDPDNYLYHWLDDTTFRDPVRGGLKADIYQVEVISKETGCSLPMNIPVGEIGAPDVQIEASGDSIQCPGTEIMLVAKGANVYEWQLFPGEDLDTLIVTPWKDTEYVVKGTTVGADGKECSAFATHTVRIFPYTLPDLGTDRSVCEGETVELDGGSHFIKWNWSTGDTTEIVEFSELNDSILTLQVTDTNRCVLHDTIRVVFKPVPEIELGRDRAVCKGSPFTLDAGEADSYLWNTGDTTRQITVNQTSIYEVTITTDGCTNSDRVGIRVNDPNLLKIDSIVSNDISCYGKSDGEIKIFASGEGSVYTFSLDDGVSFSENQGYFQHLDAGSYPVVVSEDSACTVRYPHPVEIREPAEIVINYKQISPSCDQCNDGELILNISGGNPPYDILWSDLETGRKRSNLTLGDYPVWITDAHKCTGYRLVTLEMGHVALSIPNAFTPNGDGINETWIIASLNGFPDALVQVFDRFGRKVYESEKGYPVPWDGRDTDGNLLPMGSYFYIIRYNITQPPVSGTVTLIH